MAKPQKSTAQSEVPGLVKKGPLYYLGAIVLLKAGLAAVRTDVAANGVHHRFQVLRLHGLICSVPGL